MFLVTPNIADLDGDVDVENSVRASNRDKWCSNASYLSTDMSNWTMLGFLVQYETVCNNPEIMNLRLSKWSGQLLFEEIPGSQSTQDICAPSFSSGGHVNRREKYILVQRILEQGLLRYKHLKHSLTHTHRTDDDFWNEKKSYNKVANASRIKSRIRAAIHALELGYKEHKILDDVQNLRAVGIHEMKVLFRAFLGVLLMIANGVTCAAVKSRYNGHWGNEILETVDSFCACPWPRCSEEEVGRRAPVPDQPSRHLVRI